MQASFYRDFHCSCTNACIMFLSVIEHFVVLAILFLYELGWDDPSHPVASVAFFPEIDNPLRRDSHF